MMPARPYGPAGVHRAPFRPEPIVLATAGDPADTQRAALQLLAAGFTDEAHAILCSGADAGFPACRLAAGMLERNPPATGEARRILQAAVEGEL
jgi:hypothetical protein